LEYVASGEKTGFHHFDFTPVVASNWTNIIQLLTRRAKRTAWMSVRAVEYPALRIIERGLER
jgi:hypothetical protein